MRTVNRTLLTIGFTLAVVAGFACSDPEAEMAAIRDTEVQALEASQQQLADLRQELAGLDEQLAAAAASEEGEVDTAELESQIEAKSGEITEAADSFTGQVIEFLNKYPMIEGEPPTDYQLKAVRMKSDEDILLASEYIEKGGDYKRAMTIYQEALKLDPDYDQLKAALAQAEELRYMTEDRFAAAKKGMDPDQVREALGPVNLRNIRDYEDKKVTAWYYPTSGEGAAAAVWFRSNKNGDLSVYKTDFTAIKGNTEGEDAG